MIVCGPGGKKKEISADQLLTERKKFAPHLMVSAGVCYGGKGQLHFVEEKAKVNAEYCVNKILPNLIEDCRRILPGQFIFQVPARRGSVSHSVTGAGLA